MKATLTISIDFDNDEDPIGTEEFLAHYVPGYTRGDGLTAQNAETMLRRVWEDDPMTLVQDFEPDLDDIHVA